MISPPAFHVPGVTFGPRTRSSSLSASGTRRSSQPGTGTPILPARSIEKCTLVVSGEVSVCSEYAGDTGAAGAPTCIAASVTSA